MIECRLGENTKGRYISAAGTLPELETDLVMLINSIYNSLRNHSPEAAEFFAGSFPRMLTDLKDKIFGPEIAGSGGAVSGDGQARTGLGGAPAPIP